MGFLKDLLKNKNNYNERLNITIYIINIFLILVHVFLSVFYFLAHHNFMLIANLFSMLFYISALFFCTKFKDTFLRIAFVEIWVHTLLGVCSFGWDGYFQNWIFALLAAVFLTAYNPGNKEQSYKQSLIFSIILVLSYFLFALLVNTVKIPFMIELSDNMKDVIFALNNFVTFASIIFFAVTYTRNKEEKEIELLKNANYDELTGIFNRHGIDSIEYALKGKSYSIAILDLDFFKPVNDKYGHKAGDRVLEGIGKILNSHISKNIIVGRWGGEEFLVIGNSDIKYEDFVNELEKIREEIESTPFTIKDKKKINITVSIGSKHIKIGKTIEEGVALADINLYKAKESGRNKVIS